MNHRKMNRKKHISFHPCHHVHVSYVDFCYMTQNYLTRRTYILTFFRLLIFCQQLIYSITNHMPALCGSLTTSTAAGLQPSDSDKRSSGLLVRLVIKIKYKIQKVCQNVEDDLKPQTSKWAKWYILIRIFSCLSINEITANNQLLYGFFFRLTWKFVC